MDYTDFSIPRDTEKSSFSIRNQDATEVNKERIAEVGKMDYSNMV